MKYRKIAVVLIATAVLLSLASIASAQSAQKDPRVLGTRGSGFTAGIVKPQQSNIYLTAAYSNANYGTGGVALRNRPKGDIQISGVTGPAQAAWLYWAVLLSNPSEKLLKEVAEVTLQREYPTGSPDPTGIQLQGTLLAVGADPCWGSSGAWVYRAAVPTNVASGNGIYRIIESGSAVGAKDGGDPWAELVFPAWEGASLVIVGTGTASVGLIDGQAGTTFAGAYSNYYQLPATIGSESLVLFDAIGYDGQIGDSRSIVSGSGYSSTNETTTVTGFPSGISVLVAGQGGETGDSDWDGSAGWPLPQLWDDTAHDISNAFAAGDTWALVSYGTTWDCVGTVSAVISVQ